MIFTTKIAVQRGIMAGSDSPSIPPIQPGTHKSGTEQGEITLKSNKKN
jgi:hypothetical protein